MFVLKISGIKNSFNDIFFLFLEEDKKEEMARLLFDEHVTQDHEVLCVCTENKVIYIIDKLSDAATKEILE